MAAIDGLVSGLDTTTIVGQLMSLERGPQTRLKSTLTAQQADITAYQAINTKMAALQAAADKVALATTWSQGKATSSNPAVTASAGTGAVSGTVSFSVTALAAAGSRIGTQTYDSLTGTPSTAVPSLSITGPKSTGAQTFTSKNGSLASLVTEINAATDLGVRAAAVQTKPGQWQLQLTAANTGKANDFTVSGADVATVTRAADATLHVGDAAAGYDITSASNTIEGVLPGVTLKATSLATDVRVDVDQDGESITSAVQALVDAANAALGEITKYTASSSTSKNVLTGDSAMADLTSRVLKAVSTAVGDDGSAVRLGLQLTRDGKITFDKAKFTSTLTSDPALVQRMVGGTPASTAPDGTAIPAVAGLADRLLSLAKSATNSTTGTVTMLAKGRDALAKDIQTRIDDWDLRLAARKATLSRQFTAMESALSSLKSQSSWLSGQLSSLSS